MDLDATPDRIRTLPSWLLNQAAASASRLVSEDLAQIGAHRTHFSLLAALNQFGPDSQAALGRRCGIDRSDMVALVNELDQRGYVRRAPDPEDRRRNTITITGPGRRRLAQLDRRLSATEDDLLEPLSAAERRALLDILARLIDHHAEIAPPASR